MQFDSDPPELLPLPEAEPLPLPMPAEPLVPLPLEPLVEMSTPLSHGLKDGGGPMSLAKQDGTITS